MSTLRPLLPALFVVVLILLAANSASAQTAAAAPEQRHDSLNYQQVTVPVMIDLLEQLSGKHYIRDANLNSVAPISVNGTGLTKDESIKLITATLLLNGVAILRVDDHTMKAITTGTNKNPRSEGVTVYTTEADLPADDEIVTYYMALDHIDPMEAAGIFIQVAPVHVYGSYVPAPSAQGLILTENASVVREMIQLKKSIDVNRAPNVPRPPPAPPGPAGSRPPEPPHFHPILHLVGMLIALAVFVFAIAAGNVIAQRWMNRGKPKAP